VRDLHDWDLGDHYLAQCSGIVVRMTHNGKPEKPQVEGNLFPSIPFDLDGPLDWLHSSLPTNFGLNGNGQLRDIWEMFDMTVQNN
jgi:hypothetical protein